jgi:starch synthase (maltosyl-transferring)
MTSTAPATPSTLPAPPEVPAKIAVGSVSPAPRPGALAHVIVGRPVAVSFEAVRDGHGILRARARWQRVAGGPVTDWVSVPLAAEPGDRFAGSLVFEDLGRYEIVLEAWTDRVATWCRDIAAWAAADEDISIELEVGARLLEELAAQSDAAPQTAATLRSTAAVLRDEQRSLADRLAVTTESAFQAECATIPDRTDLTAAPAVGLRVERERAAVGAWYEMFPRSEGGLLGAARRLPAIAEAGFDVVYLPPIHPIGMTHRKGRHNSLTAGPGDPGSPWAIGAASGGHLAIEPSLGTDADFDDFVTAAADVGLEVALDLAYQCTPDHPWVRDHPEWFRRRPDGSIRYAENPPKRYQDIHPIEFWPPEPHRGELWQACLEVVDHWIDRGVRIFRVDNPHTKPLAFWAWLIADVLDRRPDVVFLAEAFTRPAMMHALAEFGFSQSYTYFTWRRSAAELRGYLEELAWGPFAEVFRPNFWPTTPDILVEPLRNGSVDQFKVRALLAALLSPSWGIYSGYEFVENVPQSPENEEFDDSEKYRIVARDWSAPQPLGPWLATLNSIRRHRGFARLDTLGWINTSHPDVLAWYRRDPDGAAPVLVIVNTTPDVALSATVQLDTTHLGLPGELRVSDRLTGETWHWHDGSNLVEFTPGQRVAHVLVPE